jgi:macrolide transport system ATP-binding/permease protein
MRMAMRSLRANPFRTFLTLLGVVIGVAAVVALLGIGEGAKQRLVEEINTLGANRLSVWADTRTYPGATLTFDDAEAVARRVHNIKAVLPTISGTRTVRIGNRDHTTTVNSTTAEYPVMRNWPVASGIFFDDADSEASNAVAILGATVVEQLFPNGEDPLGRYVLIGKVPFLVIGTMTRKGAAGFGSRDQDDVVLVPLKTGARRLFGQSSLQAMTVSVEDSSLIDQAEADVRATLVARHGIDDIRIRNSAEMQQTMAEAISTATLILGAIGAISLLVGGIGVMNIMLVSVTERTREIGIRVATGARRGDIMVQFLVEAIVVTGVGGLVGLGVAFGIGLLVSLAFPEIRVAFTLIPMIAAFACATTIGLVFGFAPARNAASLDPVVALSND